MAQLLAVLRGGPVAPTTRRGAADASLRERRAIPASRALCPHQLQPRQGPRKPLEEVPSGDLAAPPQPLPLSRALRGNGDVRGRHGADFSHFLGLLQSKLLIGGLFHLLLIL